MRKYTRSDFIGLPEGIIYSRIAEGSLLAGMFCKGETYGSDWVEQDLISEAGFPNGIDDGSDAYRYQENLRDSYMDFRTDLNCGGRDGMFEKSDEFIVWDREDVQKLTEYLIDCLKTAYGA